MVPVPTVQPGRPAVRTLAGLSPGAGRRPLWAGVGVLGLLGMMLMGWWAFRGASTARETPAATPRIAKVDEPDHQPIEDEPRRLVEHAAQPPVEATEVPPAPPAPAADPVPADRRALTTREVVAKSEASVAMIKGALGSGSGFVVAPGLVATNAHVIDQEPVRRLEVHFPSAPLPDRGPFKARLRYKDGRRDLALLEIETRLTPLELCRSHVLQRGEEVTIIGSPGLRGDTVLKNAVSRGVVSTDAELNGERFLQLGASVNSGNSGGPAFNAQGEVIGVVTAKAAEKEAIGFCIPAEDVISALRKADGLSRDQIEIVEKMHDVESIARRIRIADSIYDRAVSRYLNSMLEADRAGGGFHQGLLAAKREIGPRLTEMHRDVVQSLPGEVTELAADPHLSLQTRQALESLWDAFVARRRFVESPPEDLQDFMAALDRTEKRLDERLGRMARALGTKLDD